MYSENVIRDGSFFYGLWSFYIEQSFEIEGLGVKKYGLKSHVLRGSPFFSRQTQLLCQNGRSIIIIWFVVLRLDFNELACDFFKTSRNRN